MQLTDQRKACARPDLPLLFTPLKLRGLTVRNRVVVSPMCQYRSVEGGPTDWHLVHLGKFAMGGAGIVFGDETAVEARGRKTHACAGIFLDDHIPQYRRITDFLKSLGAVPAIQLGHAGRKASCHGAMRNWTPLTDEDAAIGLPPWTGIAPSPIPSGPGARTPHELTIPEIRDVLERWSIAARRATDSGFDVCEIHDAHGYLIHQFLSPIANKRTDGYGGDRAGRMRFALEIAEVVRSNWPADRPVFFRMSVVDGRGGEWVVEDSVALSIELKARGIDIVDCSSGGLQGNSTFPLVPRVPGYHVSYASRIRREAGVGTVAVGLITSPHHAESILQAGDADLVALARGIMYESDWPAHAAAALGVPNHYDLFPPDYAYRFNGRDRTRSGYPRGCDVGIPHSPNEEIPYQWPSEPGAGGQ